jgi:hypothetical protein
MQIQYLESNGLLGTYQPLKYVNSEGSRFPLMNDYGLGIQVSGWMGETKFTYSSEDPYSASNNISSLNETSENGQTISYGTATSTLPIDLGGVSAAIRNVYSLAQNGSILKISTTITNTDSTNAINDIKAQAGIADTMAGDDDVNFKRGNISNTGFNILSDISSRSNSIIAHYGDVNAVLYSKSATANSKWYSDCCSAYGLFNVSPSDSTIYTNGNYYDGSMALEYSIHNLAPGASYTFTWFIGGSNNADLK